MKLIGTKKFERSLARLANKQPDIETKLAKTLNLLKSNPNHPSLRLQKLEESDTYSISVNMSIRIILLWEGEIVYLLDIGTHDEVYR